jgi:adenosine deaminase
MRRPVSACLAIVLSAASVVASAQSHPTRRPASPVEDTGDRSASAAFEAARNAGPLALYAFLARMPKGADLHMHLSGAIYAETFIKDAAEDHLCVDTAKDTLVSPPAASGSSPTACPRGSVAAVSALTDQKLYDQLVDSFSMRSFEPTPGFSGHDQFFATFDRFDAIGEQHLGEWLDEVATRAASQNEQYLEIMKTPPFGHAARLGYEAGWPSAAPAVTTAPEDLAGAPRSELAALRDKLIAAGLRDEVAADRAQLASGLAQRARLEHCDRPAAARPACSVEIRFLYQVLRGFPPQQVFAQTLLGFEVAAVEPLVAGINFVMPEDGYLSMSEYHRQMLMLDYLHSVYPTVHISLHAGELVPGLVPPAGLRFHIREAIELGHAERIGHGVDVLYEDRAAELLKELAQRHIMIEANLTSNAVILGVTPATSPLLSYRSAHVPVALSTDDEGVSRIDLTHEYTRAALEFHLGYADLKQMARTSLEHSFLPGLSLWSERDNFAHPIQVCDRQPLGGEALTPACADFLARSPRATQQWELEHRFRAFEAGLSQPR